MKEMPPRTPPRPDRAQQNFEVFPDVAQEYPYICIMLLCIAGIIIWATGPALRSRLGPAQRDALLLI